MENTARILDRQALIEEALANFAALVEDTDYDAIFGMMGIGRLQFLRRKQMRLELAALRMALWRLALGRSFPEDADMMFDEFLKRYALAHPSRPGALAVSRAREYWGMLAPKGDSDFNGVARHLASFLAEDNYNARALPLKLALYLRRDYRFIFDRLI